MQNVQATSEGDQILRRFNRDLPVTLNEHELQAYGKMLAEKVREEELADERRKQVAAQHATQIKGIRVEVKRIAEARAKGEELRPVPCGERLRGNVIEIVRLDRMEVVETRPAEMRDLQTSMPGVVGDPKVPDFDEGPRGDALGNDDGAKPEHTGANVTSSVGDTVHVGDPNDAMIMCGYCGGEVDLDHDAIEMVGGDDGAPVHKECADERRAATNTAGDGALEHAAGGGDPDDDELDRRLAERDEANRIEDERKTEARADKASEEKPKRERSAKANASKNGSNGKAKKRK